MAATPSSNRFVALDELRAIAVMSMCIAHFSPGMIERFDALQPLANMIGIIGRLSTVAFVASFGLTLGFVQFPHYIAGQSRQVREWLVGRSRLLFFCVLFVSTPAYIGLATDGIDQPFTDWLWSTYNVLNFYVLAMLSVPFWFRVLQQDTVMRAVMLSAIHWMAFALLIQNWPQADDAPVLEYVRLNVVSGGYAYLPLAAVTLLAIAAGIWARQRFSANELPTAIRGCALAGGVLAVFAFGLGTITDMSAHAIAVGSVKDPARLWYWCLFGGATLVIFSVIAALHAAYPRLRFRTRWIALFGQSALGVYTLHTWVLPILNWSDAFFVSAGAVRAAFALSLFILFCALAMVWYARRNRAKPASFRPSTRLTSAGGL